MADSLMSDAPLADREKELARLDADIGKLEKQLADLSIAAAEAGVSIHG
jgi:hypothetical protein